MNRLEMGVQFLTIVYRYEDASRYGMMNKLPNQELRNQDNDLGKLFLATRG